MFPFWVLMLGQNSERARRKGLPPMRAREVLEVFLAGLGALALLFGMFWLAQQA